MEEELSYVGSEGSAFSNKLPKVFAILFSSILSLPGLILAGIYYYIFFIRLKWKPTISGLLSLFLFFILFIFGIIIHPFRRITLEYSTWILPYFYIALYFGVIVGYGFILWQARKLKIYPELRVLQGWAKDFEYAESPFDKIKKKKVISSLKDGSELSLDMAPMGVLIEPVKIANSEDYKSTEVVGRYYIEANKNTIITGATGSGKTITMTNLIYNDICAGYPICVIDFKKGVELPYLLSKWAKEHNRKFLHFVNGEPGAYNNPYCKYQASYDPLGTGLATSKADMVLNLRKWDSASDVYKGRTQSILQSIFFLLENVDKEKVKCIPWDEGGVAQFVKALETPNLGEMIAQYKSNFLINEPSPSEKRRLNELINFYNELVSTTKSPLREQMEGLAHIFRTLVMSSYSPWLAKGETPNHINLFNVATSKSAPIVLFQFNPNEEPEFAAHMGSIILSDIKRAAGYKERKGDKTPFGLYIDEPQTLDPNFLLGIIEKARSAQFFTTLSYQSLEQISKSTDKQGEETLKSVMDTVSNYIVHSGSSYDTAERFSKLIGKTNIVKYKVMGKRNSSIFSSNLKNSRNSMVNTVIEEDYKISPSAFQQLSSPNKSNNFTATAYYITKECSDPNLSGLSQAIARKMQVVVNDRVLDPVPDSFKKNLFGNNSISKRPKRKLQQTQNTDLYDKIESVQKPSSNVITKTRESSHNVAISDIQNEEKNTMESFLENTSSEMRMSQRKYAKENYKEGINKPRKTTSFHKNRNKE